MRIALGVALLAAGLTVGLWIWAASDVEQLPVEALPQSPEPIAISSEAIELQTPEVGSAPRALSRAPATPTRSAVASPDAKSKVEPSAKSVTTLRVRVLAQEDQSPLKDKLLALRDKGAVDPAKNRLVRSPRGRLGGSRSTGEDGWAEMEVDPDCEYSILVVGLQWDKEEHSILPLTPGERREIELLVPTRDPAEDDLVFFGVLLDADNSMPVVRGTLQVQGEVSTAFSPTSGTFWDVNLEGPPVRTDFDGRFKILDKSKRRRSVSATAPGYARAMFTLDTGHSISQEAMEVRMSRSASVDAIVTDSTGAPIADAIVDLTNEDGYLSRQAFSYTYNAILDPHWTAKTDAQGLARVVDLPPDIPLQLIVKRQGFPSREETEPLVLRTGERRRIEIPWGTGGLVRGLLLDGDGRPVANHRIWRMMCDSPNPRPIVFKDNGKPAAATRTDADGRFEFAETPLGVWYVGIAPESEALHESEGFPAYAEPVVVRGEGEVIEFVLSVEPGLYVQGRVLDQRGDPVHWCSVMGALENTPIAERASTDSSGAFKLGPLVKGMWVLEVRDQLAPPLPTRVQAGTNGIIIRLQTGASIAGAVVDGSNLAPADCFLSIASIDGARVRQSTTWADRGNFKFTGLVAGTYVISASDEDGAFGLSEPISIAEDQALQGVRITLAAGAKLKLRYDGDSRRVTCEIHAGAAPIASPMFDKGRSCTLPVPAGSIEMRWKDSQTETTKTESITLGLGEVREFAWDGKP